MAIFEKWSYGVELGENMAYLGGEIFFFFFLAYNFGGDF
jgi:hypothetical protein